MNGKALVTIMAVLVMLTGGCSGHKTYHPADMPDPKAYNAHFDDMDANGDGLVDWVEFAAHFQNAEMMVFEAVDLNQDAAIDHDEWHEFKAAHGLEHME